MNAPEHGVETWARNLYRHKLSLLQYEEPVTKK